MGKCGRIVLVFLLMGSCLGDEVQVQNNCGQTLWINNNGGDSGPFSLPPGQSNTIPVDQGASVRVWGLTGCDDNGNNCDTFDGQNSLAEMHWDSNGMTWYDISQVDAYNLPITLNPYNPAAGGNCGNTNCNFDMVDNCPQECMVYNGAGTLVACQSQNRDAVTDYSTAIKEACPGVYSWSQDDAAGMRACQPGNNGLVVSFC